ncbi:MAG TPA: ADOP family duplicated permease [Acidobacteriaceae bacterium]|jgi:predicted permease|nr:ADOP family duplicated permease [Acidobacteriaceae bacterium]
MLEDLRYALRQLKRSPGFAAAVVVTLALAIGVNTAVFSLLDGFLLRSLPYPQPERIAALVRHLTLKSNPGEAEDDDSADSITWAAVKQDVPSVTAAITGQGFGDTEGVNLEAAAAQGGATRYVHGALVSAHYFQVLGIEPLLGRGFTEDEDRPGAGRAVVLSYGLWHSLFHDDAGILGKPILLKGAAYTVVGVMPPGAQMPHPADVWTPLMPDDPRGVCAGNNCLILMRLKPGANWEQVRAKLAHMPPSRNDDLTRVNAVYGPSLLRAYAASAMKPQTEALMLAVGFILLIACANLAGLMLARIHRRTPEMATRMALGASRGRILRQLWVENLLLAVVGGAAGVALAAVLFPAMRQLLPRDMMPIGGFALNGAVLLFALGASLVTSLLFGALPALETRRVDLRSSISSGTRSVAGGSGRVRQGLIGAEVALTVVLLAGAGLLIRTVVHLETLPPGFDAHNVMTAKASLDDARFQSADSFQRLLRESVLAMQRIPGVEDAAVALSVPYERGLNDGLTVADGPRAGYDWGSRLDWVTPQFFAALRIPIVSGRALRESDTAASQPVAVVNEDFGRKFYNDPNPVGRHFRAGKTTFVIVGVVPNVVKTLGMSPGAPLATEPLYYVTAAQASQSLVNLANMWFQPSWIVRTREPIGDLTAKMQQALTAAAPGLPFSGFYSMEDVMHQQLQMQRIEVTLLGTLAGLALLLSAVGIYALVSNLVVQRTREIGIRIALGSTLGGAMRHIASSGLAAAGGGVLAGLACCFFVLRVMKSSIYGVGTYDPVTLLTVPLVLLAIAAAASVLPALRIARIDPAETLRAE